YEGVAPYTPNSLAGGCPFSPTAGSYVHVPRVVSGERVRERAASFSDHYSQGSLFWNSMAPVEQEHIVAAFSFELSKCASAEIREHMVTNLANVDEVLCARVAANLGLQAPAGATSSSEDSSPALSQIRPPGP